MANVVDETIDSMAATIRGIAQEFSRLRGGAIEAMCKAHEGRVAQLVYRQDVPGVHERIEAQDAAGAVLDHVDIVIEAASIRIVRHVEVPPVHSGVTGKVVL